MEVMNSGWTEIELCNLYRDAKNKKEQIKIIAELLGMTNTKFAIEILERGGVLEMDDKKKEEILREYYNNALSDSAIAKKTGVAQSQVSTFLRKKGLPPNGKLYNKKEEKAVEEIKSIEQLEDEKAKQDLNEVKQELTLPAPMLFKEKIRPEVKKEIKQMVEEVKAALPKSMPAEISEVKADTIETLTPGQYFYLAKTTLELLKTIWEA